MPSSSSFASVCTCADATTRRDWTRVWQRRERQSNIERDVCGGKVIQDYFSKKQQHTTPAHTHTQQHTQQRCFRKNYKGQQLIGLKDDNILCNCKLGCVKATVLFVLAIFNYVTVLCCGPCVRFLCECDVLVVEWWLRWQLGFCVLGYCKEIITVVLHWLIWIDI